MLFRLFRAVLSVALIFGAIWTAVIWHWQVTHRYPTAADIVLKLGVLPTGAAAGYWILRRAAGFARARWNQAASPQAPAAEAPSAAEAPDGNEAAYRLHLLAAGVRLPLGDDAQAVLAAVESGASPGLDPELKDDDGLPVFASRVPGLEVEELRKASAAWAPPRGFSTEQLHALVLADALLEDLTAQAKAMVLAGTGDGKVPPPLRTLFMFPDHWSEETVRGAGSWLRQRVVQGAWPQAQVLGEAVLVRDGAQAIAALDNLLLMLNRNQAPDLCCVLACNSDVGEETLAQWSRAGTLMSSANRLGRIPGEGAAGLLLSAAPPAPAGEAQMLVALHRAALGKREQSVDTQARVNGDTARQLCEQALQQAAADPKSVDCLLSDADHRPSRAVEVGALTTGLFTELAPQRHYALEAACGHLGATATVAGIALGASRAQAERKPAAVLSVADAFERAALVLTATPVTV